VIYERGDKADNNHFNRNNFVFEIGDENDSKRGEKYEVRRNSYDIQQRLDVHLKADPDYIGADGCLSAVALAKEEGLKAIN